MYFVKVVHVALVGNERGLPYYNSWATKSLTVTPVWDTTIHHSENKYNRSDIWCCHRQTVYVPRSFCLSCLQCRGECNSSFAALISELSCKPLVVADFKREKDNHLSVSVEMLVHLYCFLNVLFSKIKYLYFLFSLENQTQCSWIIFKKLKKEQVCLANSLSINVDFNKAD